MKFREYITGGYKQFGITPLKLIWQLIIIIPLQFIRLIFCIMIVLFNLDIKLFSEAWKQTG
jgi:hypothetical protein